VGRANLEIVRGDDRTFTLLFTDSNGVPINITGCTLFFTAKSKDTPDYLEIGTCTITVATPCVVTKTTHGLLATRKIRFTTTEALPPPLMEEEDYYVKYIGADTFNIATVSAGDNINTTGIQSGVHTLWAISTPASDTDADSLILYTWDIHSSPTIGESQFSLVPADTKNMSGLYPFDIQLKDISGHIFTVMYGYLNVIADVTKRIL